MPDAQIFALALRRLDGVGRVTAGRLLEHFATYADLRRYPREQVLHRVKGAPNAAALVATLFDEAAMQPLLEAAAEERQALQRRGINLRTPADPDWPGGLARLPRAERPLLLFLYGDGGLLARRGVYVLGRHGLAPDAFEAAQHAVRRVVADGLVPWTGLEDGFHVALARTVALAPAPCVMMPPCGLANVAPPMRPVASQAVRAGGLLVAPFEMNHGPFEHDARERSRIATALCEAVLVCAEGAESRVAVDTARAIGTQAFAATDALAAQYELPLLSLHAPLPL